MSNARAGRRAVPFSRRFQCRICSIVCALFSAGALAPPVEAQEPAPAQSRAMSAAELAEARAGYLHVDGLAFDFGAIVRTEVDGNLALETRLTWTPDGIAVDRSPVNFAGANLNQDGALTITDPKGYTAISNGLMDGKLQSVIVNSADNRDVSNSINVTLTLPGFEAVQNAIDFGRFTSQLNADLSGSLAQATQR